MRKLLLTMLLVVGSAFSEDLVCESNITTSATYNWDNTAGWNCYGQRKVVQTNEYPGKNYPTNNYSVVLGAASGSNIVTEHQMNVNSTLGIGGKVYNRWTVSAAADNGSGLIRLTTATNTIVTGDKLFCVLTNGTNPNNAYGIWPVTVIDTTHIDLQGSSYSGMASNTAGTCEYPAALKRQGNGTTTAGKWKINPGVTITVRGDIVDNWSTATRLDNTFWLIRCGDSTGGGCTWIWDGSAGYAYSAGFNGYTAPYDANVSYSFRGTPALRATVTCLAGGSPCPTTASGGFRNYRISTPMGGLDIDYADFSNVGLSGSGYAFAVITDAASVFSMKHFTWKNSGIIYFASPSIAPPTFTVAYGVFEECLNTLNVGCLYNISAPVDSPITIGPAVTFAGATYGPFTSVVAGSGPIIMDRIYTAKGPAASANVAGGAAGTKMVDSIFAKPPAGGPGGGANGYGTLGMEEVINSFFWTGHDFTSPGNPHLMLAPSIGGTTLYASQFIFDGNILHPQSNYMDGNGQGLDEAQYTNGATVPVHVYVRNNLFLPSTDYAGDPAARFYSSNSMAFVVNVPNLFWHIYNNTDFFTTESGMIGLGHTGAQVPTGKIAEFRCNVGINSISQLTQTLVATETLSTSNVDAMNPDNAHHNASYNFRGSRATNAALVGNPAYGTLYSVKVSKPIAGVANGTDQIYDTSVPRFVDITRRLHTWAAQKYGSTLTDWLASVHPGATLADTDVDLYVLEFLRSDVAGAGPTRLLDIPDLVSWIKAGWTLNEPALRGACGDGTNIGALVAAAVTNPSRNSLMFTIP